MLYPQGSPGLSGPRPCSSPERSGGSGLRPAAVPPAGPRRPPHAQHLLPWAHRARSAAPGCSPCSVLQKPRLVLWGSRGGAEGQLLASRWLLRTRLTNRAARRARRRRGGRPPREGALARCPETSLYCRHPLPVPRARGPLTQLVHVPGRCCPRPPLVRPCQQRWPPGSSPDRGRVGGESSWRGLGGLSPERKLWVVFQDVCDVVRTPLYDGNAQVGWGDSGWCEMIGMGEVVCGTRRLSGISPGGPVVGV